MERVMERVAHDASSILFPTALVPQSGWIFPLSVTAGAWNKLRIVSLRSQDRDARIAGLSLHEESLWDLRKGWVRGERERGRCMRRATTSPCTPHGKNCRTGCGYGFDSCSDSRTRGSSSFTCPSPDTHTGITRHGRRSNQALHDCPGARGGTDTFHFS